MFTVDKANPWYVTQVMSNQKIQAFIIFYKVISNYINQPTQTYFNNR